MYAPFVRQKPPYQILTEEEIEK